MTTAHWHLILTHLPIVAIPFAAVLMLAGIRKNSHDLRKAALIAFVFCGAATFFAKQTGDGAEDQVENLPGFSRSIVQQHESMADRAFVLTSLLAVVALVALGVQRRRALPVASDLAILGLAIAASAVLIYTGALGGQIRHTEIRQASVSLRPPEPGGSTSWQTT